jgi:hypothetical protein
MVTGGGSVTLVGHLRVLMSVEIKPKFHPPVPKLFYRAEGKALADQIRQIRSFCKKHGIRPITAFLDDRVMSDDEEQADAGSVWHQPADGLKAVQALVNAIESDPKSADRWNKEDPDGLETLLDDLGELARCLEVAATHGVQFRLIVT